MKSSLVLAAIVVFAYAGLAMAEPKLGDKVTLCEQGGVVKMVESADQCQGNQMVGTVTTMEADKAYVVTEEGQTLEVPMMDK